MPCHSVTDCDVSPTAADAIALVCGHWEGGLPVPPSLKHHDHHDHPPGHPHHPGGPILFLAWLTEGDRERARRLHRTGWSKARISRHMGLTTYRVNKLLAA